MLTLSKFVNDLDRTIQQAIGQNALRLAKGQCKNFEEYHRHVGRCEGMEAAVDAARQMLRQVELSDDEPGLPEMPGDTEPQKARGGERR